MRRMWCCIATMSGALACTGQIDDSPSVWPGSMAAVPSSSAAPLPRSPRTLSSVAISMGARRLSRHEYDRALGVLLGDTTAGAAKYLPEDVFTPFDNEFQTQQVSASLIEGAELLARETAARWRSDVGRRSNVLGCSPSGASDAACLRSFIAHFGRLALRRALTEDEVNEYALFQKSAEDVGDFYQAAEMVISAFLQDPEFLYRIEREGAPTTGAGGAPLAPFELASRMSFFLWGEAPDAALLDSAEHGGLSDADSVRRVAEQMMADPRARTQVERFHALWFGYHQLPHPPELATPMIAETNALVDEIVFDSSRPWLDLFRAEETFIDATLAQNYGLPAPSTGFAWTPYGSTGRGGILSHGAFLSINARFGDTSPTQRGILVRQRLACQAIPPPPPNVNVDVAPTDGVSTCKQDRYRAHSASPTCRSCHSQIDPVGFGLENYDMQGRYRDHEADHPECVIPGEGALEPVGAFHGPKELGDRLVSSGILEPCLVRRVFRFAMGQADGDTSQPLLGDLKVALTEGGVRLDRLMLALVTHPAFSTRQDESP